MSNEIKKPSDEASEVSVARYLMQQFPEWKGQLKNLVHAYKMPFQHSCKNEAAYRLGELGIPDSIHDYASMVSSVADELFNSKTFINGDVAEQITTSVLDKDFCLDIKDEKQVLFLKENYFKSELLLTLSGLKTDIPFLASFVCKTNTKKSNRNMEVAFQKVLENHETDCGYITTKELQELFLAFQKDYRDNQARIKIPGGELVAEESSDQEHPGICVYLELESGDIMDLALMKHHNKDGKSSIEICDCKNPWSNQQLSIDVSEVKKVFENNETLQDNENPLHEEYRMEWSSGIVSKKDYNYFVASCLLNPDSITNYEQAACLFYHEGKDTVMVKLQVPTKCMCMDGNIHNPWIDVFRAKDMQDYNASDEIESVLHEGDITFENAKELMLQVARENI